MLSSFLLVVLAALVAPATPAASSYSAALQEEVRATERAFAKSMADRDHAAFVSFLSEEAVFLGETVLRGKQEIAARWRRFFDGAQAPFAWEPERVEVLDSGGLAFSTGPVTDPAGNRVGTYTSTWLREADSEWRIVFDGGCPPCSCT